MALPFTSVPSTLGLMVNLLKSTFVWTQVEGERVNERFIYTCLGDARNLEETEWTFYPCYWGSSIPTGILMYSVKMVCHRIAVTRIRSSVLYPFYSSQHRTARQRTELV